MKIECKILMSLRKEPFEAICRGEKQHEFRRRYNLYKRPQALLIYVPSPVKAIEGIIIFGAVIKDTVNNLAILGNRHKYKGDANIKEYMQGLDKGYALPVLEAKRLNKPLTLDRLRETIPGFCPPQSYYGIKNNKYSKILEDIEKNGICNVSL